MAIQNTLVPDSPQSSSTTSLPPKLARLFQRLEASAPGYTWDRSVLPFHSVRTCLSRPLALPDEKQSYDNWHVFGTQYFTSEEPYDNPPTSPKHTASPSVDGNHRPLFVNRSSSSTTDGGGGESVNVGRNKKTTRKVVARVSRHALRLEREYQICKHITRHSDQECKHFVKPIQFFHVPASPGEEDLVASIFETPGPHYLRELVAFGPNVHKYGQEDAMVNEKKAQMSLQLFLNFAISATECCEILHHEHQLVHGELRTDAFHFCQSSGQVKMVNFGSGARAFQDGLTSAGWSALSKEVGVEHKLQFIAPEQTGRLPAEPDSRTDIYSLGILFWSFLTGERPFDGKTPLEIMQNVLSRRIPSVSSKRLDVPDIISTMIQKMTQKNIDDRYNSTAGLKHDLVQIQKLLSDGDGEGLRTFSLGSKDISSFFMLPTTQIGRKKERQAILDVIERVSKRRRHQIVQSKRGIWGSSSSTTDSRQDNNWMEDKNSESSSSTGRDSRLNSFSNKLPDSKRLNHDSQDNILESEWSISEEALERPTIDTRASNDSKNSYHGSEAGQRTTSAFGTSEGSGTKLRNAHRTRRKGRCEVISISGVPGLGKSVLVQSIQVAARSHGYLASGKFDQAKRAPFEPVLKVMSSLFRQIFSESDVNTDFHCSIRNYVKPAWSILHSHLGLPIWLLGPSSASDHTPTRALSFQNMRAAHDMSPPTISAMSTATGTPNGVNSPSGTHGNNANNNNTADWLRAGGAAMSSRFSNTFLDVLNALAVQRLICLCLDDLQFADDESLDLLDAILSTRIPVVLILTHRSDEVLPTKCRSVLESATKINLKPFEEGETAELVSTTLHRNPDYILPLVAVIQEKCLGNPFMIKEMLTACYRRGCIFYSWKNSQWEYDLDKIFSEFASQSYGSQISNDFILKRLQDLPQDARALLAWASVIGNHFSFKLVKELMSCGDLASFQIEQIPLVRCRNPVAGLQTAISSYFIMAEDDEDRFRFSHDRYMQAAADLEECAKKEEMHFLVAQMMIRMNTVSLTDDSTMLHTLGRHICFASEIIKERVKLRAIYRDILYQAAENSCESGAKATGLYYLHHCIELLQTNPWETGLADAFYNETLSIYTRAAEICWHEGDLDRAMELLQAIFDHAHDPIDKTPACVLQSRILAQRGDSHGVFMALERSLAEMGKEIPKMSWEDCDAEFQRIREILQSPSPGTRPRRRSMVSQDIVPLGAILVEISSAAFWADALTFYQMTLQMLQLYLDHGLYPQVGIAFVQLASIAVGRFDDTDFGIRMGNIAKEIFDRFRDDNYTIGRGLTLHCLCIGHLEAHIRQQFPVLEEALERTVNAGDRLLTLMNLGVSANLKMFSSHDLADVEAYCSYCPDEFKDWHKDMRGGAFLTSIKQLARALQGKTKWQSPDTLICDDEHDTKEYLGFLEKMAANPRRPVALYKRYFSSDTFLQLSTNLAHLVLSSLECSTLATMRE